MHLLDDPVWVVALVSAGIFVVAGAAQAVSGFGLALAAVPLLTWVVGPEQAVAVAVVVGVVVTARGWAQHRSEVDPARVRRLTGWAVLGLPLGLVAVTLMSTRALAVLIAVTVLLLVVALASGVRLPAGRPAERVAGAVSGALLTSTAMNGPPLVLVLDGAGLEKRSFRATLQAVFCLHDVMAMAAFAVLGLLTTTVLVASGGGVVGVLVGWWLGDLVFEQLSPTTFRRLVLGGLVVASLAALAGALA
ncbi:Sulfite exporter TauE/SafE [Nocardioides dokdonensis FR1436]|uniref:Probable membrane transporter protein n=1 Tax=Nocardioides dokdonensis FR1436 TaxID=1300347 RepID=A0A1A9GFE2_9ACTN|nr:sulfite exporter TauE/SafE family protein [Nocardioides dokdonensis]ANH37007.1 Sulfite exporter TauE/SafE [Nocardioides dokdonensis FR1436]